LRELIEAGAWLIGSLVTTASTIGYLRARDRSTTERFESLEARVLLLESPSDAITRAEFEAMIRPIVDRTLKPCLQALSDAEVRPEISGGTDPKTQMYKVLSGTKRIGSNGGTLAGLVGSYEQVIERIEAFRDAGIELFMLQFQPIEAELDRFADKIIPHFR